MSSGMLITRLKDLVGKTDGHIFLLLGPAGSGKESFANQYIIDGFAEKDNAVFLTTDSFPKDIIEKMKLMGSDPSQYISNKQLEFIDAFSYRTGEKLEKNKMSVENIRDLTHLSVIIKNSIDTKTKLRLVINTISTISIYNSEVALLDFIQAQVARLKQKNHSGMFIAHEGMMAEKVIQGIKAIVDGVIEFKPLESADGDFQRRLRVTYAPNIKKAGWVSLYQ